MAKKYTDKELKDWFIGNARSAAGYRRNMFTNNERSKGNTVIGKMFFFQYDPKLKNVLPIYDRYPLVFPIERYSDGFLGINTHYLGLDERSVLLDQLAKFANNKTMNERTRLALSYDVLMRTKTLAGLTRPCVKRYLFGHVRSRFIEIIPDEWDKVAQLPLELFITKQ